MKLTYLTKSCIVILILLFTTLYVNGQNNDFMYSINATGADLSGNDGSFNYSIGQVFYSNIEADSHSITQGIRQNHLEELPNNEDIDVPIEPVTPQVDVLIYPNPTTDYVTLAAEGINLNSQLNSYQLYNYQGKLLKQNLIKQTHTTIDLTNMSASIYLVQVFIKEKLFKTIKIVKK